MRFSRVTSLIIGLVLLAMIIILLFLQPDEPSVAPAPLPAAPAPIMQQPQADLILDLFEPSQATLDSQHSAAAISSQIEHGMVVSFLLTRCSYIDQWEYRDAYNAFIRYAVLTRLAPDYRTAADKVRAIASSASASYSLVYGHVPCTDPSVPPLVDQLQDWVKKIKKTN